MHANLIIGDNIKLINQKIKSITLNQSIIDYELKKIDDLRNLEKILKLKINKPQTIIIHNIDEFTNEVANAFLKNLEEPPNNVSFILHAKSISTVLPTIISRCQIIKTAQIYKCKNKTKMQKFLSSSIGERFNILSKIKDKEEVVSFLKNLIIFLHLEIHNHKNKNLLKKAKQLAFAQNSLNAIKKNANIKLQMTNLAINMG